MIRIGILGASSGLGKALVSRFTMGRGDFEVWASYREGDPVALWPDAWTAASAGLLNFCATQLDVTETGAVENFVRRVCDAEGTDRIVLLYCCGDFQSSLIKDVLHTDASRAFEVGALAPLRLIAEAARCADLPTTVCVVTGLPGSTEKHKGGAVYSGVTAALEVIAACASREARAGFGCVLLHVGLVDKGQSYMNDLRVCGSAMVASEWTLVSDLIGALILYDPEYVNGTRLVVPCGCISYDVVYSLTALARR